MNIEKKPLVSICIPTYKRVSYLKRGLESIVSQADFNSGDFEIVVFDDASPDETEIFMREFANKHPYVKYHRNKLNLRGDRNIFDLIKGSNGEYCFFMTDDDYFLPNSLKTLKNMIEEHPDCVLFESSYLVIMERQGEQSKHHDFQESCYIEKNDTAAIVKLFSLSHMLSRVCIKRSFINLEGYERHIGSMYPHIHSVAWAALHGRSFYLHQPIIAHTIQNKTHWEYKDDYMLGGILGIIDDIGRSYPEFKRLAIDNLVSTIPTMAGLSLSGGLKNYFKFVKAIALIPQLRFKMQVWNGILSIFLKRTINFIKKNKWNRRQ